MSARFLEGVAVCVEAPGVGVVLSAVGIGQKKAERGTGVSDLDLTRRQGPGSLTHTLTHKHTRPLYFAP